MRRSNSHVIKFERCPACAKLGNDRSGDNLAVYNDGHSYCFNCGYHSHATKIVLLQDQQCTTDTKILALPRDVTQDLPICAKSWLHQYDLGRRDYVNHHVMWSPSMSRLIFPYFDSNGLLAWQGRYFGEEKKAKWFSQGNIHEIIHPINVTQGIAVLVEDIVSAIKVSSHVGAIPIFGSSISTQHWVRLKHVVHTVYLWLDPDMRQKCVKMADTARLLGLNATCIFSDKDPKEHTHNEIDIFLKEV